MLDSELGAEVQFKALCQEAARKIQVWYRILLENKGFRVPKRPRPQPEKPPSAVGMGDAPRRGPLPPIRR